ncbi:MAG: DUF362 domain-containing protein [Promethearchaeota archaeon]
MLFNRSDYRPYNSAPLYYKNLGLTLSVKNLMGCLSKARRKSTGEILHTGPLVKAYLHGFGPKNPYFLTEKQNLTISKTALAININRMAKKLMPCFSILDAAPAMEGNGPLRGNANNMNLLLFSEDSVALDALACKLVGIDLEFNQYIKNLGRLNLGSADYNNIKIVNEYLIRDFLNSGSFKFHDRFPYSKFTSKEIALLIKYT